MPHHVSPRAAGRWTVGDLERLPSDGNRYEIIDGALFVTPAPSLVHQRAAAELFAALRQYLQEMSLGEVFFAPADLEFSPDTMVQPDLMVLPATRIRLPDRWRSTDGVLLAVEIVSPASAHADRQAKRRLYQRAGIPEYWVIDLDARLVERWRPADDRPEVIAEELVWAPAGVATPFALPLAGYFAEVRGD